MPGWNQTIFLFIDASAHPAAAILWTAWLLAPSPLVVGPAVLVGLWVWGGRTRRGALLAVAGGVLVGLGINQLLGMLWFEPRPFMIGLGHTWLAHPPDNSFPSDHLTLTWGLGLGLVATGAARRTGWIVCLYGLPVAWARLFLGVHFPIDMAASAAVGAAAAGIAVAIRPVVAVAVLPWAERLYEGTLVLCHLPPGLLPRR